MKITSLETFGESDKDLNVKVGDVLKVTKVVKTKHGNGWYEPGYALVTKVTPKKK